MVSQLFLFFALQRNHFLYIQAVNNMNDDLEDFRKRWQQEIVSNQSKQAKIYYSNYQFDLILKILLISTFFIL